MSNDDVNEDLIEATIRRVAESQAARGDARTIEMPVAEAIGPVIAKDVAVDSNDDPNEDVIEATIRRVAESQAARSDASAIEMPVAGAYGPVTAAGGAVASSAEASAISARMAALRPAPRSSAGGDNGGATLQSLMHGHGAAPMQMPAPKPARAIAPAQAVAPMAPPAEYPADIGAQLQRITRQLDTVLPLLERIAASQGDSEWARTSQPSREPINMASRPSVLRNTPARAAEPARDEPDVIDTRPIPKPLPQFIEPKRGFDLLPHNYRITVEDKRRGVDLVPLHRAMLSMDGVRDMSLLSYNNGVAIVALETTDDLDPEVLRSSVSRAMLRDAQVEVHNEHTMVVKLSEE